MTVGLPVSYNMASTTNTAPHGVAGAPNEAALLALMERTGYSMVQENGQRKYGGPPPGWEGPTPARGCEAFIGKIPRDCFEDELVPIFEKIGRVYEFRLMMDFSGSNRGYAFVMYTNKGDAQRAVREINNLEIRKGRFLGVCLSVDNCRLFVGGIPKNKQREEILQEMTKITEGVVDVIVYPSATDKSKNRGFAFVEYESHRSAAMARRKLIPGRIQLWGHQIAVDWAEPEQEVDDDVMSKVKILYVRNLMLSTTEDAIRQAFEQAAGVDGCIERVKKIRDYAFVHFQEREQALTAMNMLNNTALEGSMVEVVLAKPVDKNDYVRYTRNAGRGGVLPQMTYPGLTYELAAYPTPGLYPTPTVAAAAAALATPTSRGVQNRSFMSNRGPIRGRGRGAAGSRGAGNRGGYIPGYMRNQLRKHPAELLDEICTKNGWGTPVYQLHSALGVGGDVQLYLFKVSIPALSGQYPNSSFSPNKLCRTVDEAKEYAAQFVLSQLGFPTEGAEQPTNTVVASMAATPPSLYQGHPIGPAFPVTNGRPLAPTDLTFATSVQMPVATSPSYVMAAGKVPAVTPPIQTTPDIFGYELAQFPHAFQSAAAAAALASAIPAYQAI